MDTDNGEFNTYKHPLTIAHFTSLTFHQIKQNTAQSPYVTYFRLCCKLHQSLVTRQCSSIRQMLYCRRCTSSLRATLSVYLVPRDRLERTLETRLLISPLLIVGNSASSLTSKHTQHSSCPELGLHLCFPSSRLSRHTLQTSQ